MSKQRKERGIGLEKSPFETYFGRKSNELVNAGSAYDRLIATEEVQNPTKLDRNQHKKKIESWRENASKASDRLDERMKRSHAKKYSYKKYEKGDRVFVKCKKQRGKGKSTRHMILVGSILKRYRNDSTYEISMEGPGEELMKKVRVEDLADCPSEMPHPLLIPLRHEDRLQRLTDQGYEVLYDPPSDGNCQFSSMAFALRDLDQLILSEMMLSTILVQTPDGFPMELFAGMPWSQYLNRMQRDGTYGDKITLRAIANIFNIEITVVSTLGQEGLVSIRPEDSEPLSRMILGHFAEGQGVHYIVLASQINQIDSETDQAENETDPVRNNTDTEVNSRENEVHLSENEVYTEDNEIDQRIEFDREEVDIEPKHNTTSDIKTRSENALDWLPTETLEKIFYYALSQSNYSFPGHVCWTFQNTILAIPRLIAFKKKAIGFLPRIYIKRENVLPKASKDTEEIYVNVKRLTKAFGSTSGVILEIKRIIKDSRWYYAWLALVAEAYGWYTIMNIYWKGK